jgi:Leucine-rich repeat (LRR) protein
MKYFYLLFYILAFSFTSIYAQNTNIPDVKFEEKLISLGLDDIIDGKVLTSNIENVTKIDVSRFQIKDLTGIEDFTALEILWCSENELTSIDLSKNTALKELVVIANDLQSLNISKNINLTTLVCDGNKLSILDVSNNIALTTLACGFNKLESLNVSSNVALNYLYCSDNELTSLNIKNNNNTLLKTFNATNNLNLNCITVDDEKLSDSYLNWKKDAKTAYSKDCTTFVSYTKIPDINLERKLISLNLDDIEDGKILTSNIENITSLDISFSGILDLTGIEDFISLDNLNCNNNQITILNLDSNIALTILDCSKNNIKSLDLKNNKDLKIVNCSINNITNLNLINNNYLTDLDCSNNELTSLNLKNGNNINLINFNATNNTNLKCIEVDNVVYSNSNNNWLKDTTTGYSEDCINYFYTKIPDTNFEKRLIFLGLDTILDGRVLTTNIENVINLNISFAKIKDLTGIEDFISLENLSCALNELTSIDVSKNTNLTILNCSKNKISVLNLDNNTSLRTLDCSMNQLNNLDLSYNTSLTNLACFTNQLSTLNISNNTYLRSLNCHINQLSTLNISNNTSLVYLDCSRNKLSSLDIRTNISLTGLYCFYNQLTFLNLKNGYNHKLAFLRVEYNYKLSCIEVDNLNTDEKTYWTKDKTSFYNTNCATASLIENVLENTNIFVIPSRQLEINISVTASFKIYNVKGQELVKGTLLKNTNLLDLKMLSNGLYILKLNHNNQQISKKFILN